MAYEGTDYKAHIRILVEHGDITTFSQICDRRLAGVARLAEAARMYPRHFRTIVRKGLNFSEEEIQWIADHIGITADKLTDLIKNDPLYKKEKPKKRGEQ